ncbi:transcription factor that binds to CRE motif [Ophidiomyces ophidiicola]|nr:transcription factor that binds to CRE motif [Ophidiomyces ophidiicola]
MDSTFSTFDSMSLPGSDVPQLTISPAETTVKPDDLVAETGVEASPKPEEKKPVKKRKSWGQELPTPKTNLPPRSVLSKPGVVGDNVLTSRRKRAKTEDEKEQRRIERVLRNRAAAQISRERKRLEIEKLETEKAKMEQQNRVLLQRLAQMEAENNRLSQQVAQLSTEIRSSRGASPQSSVSAPSPTLSPILFKHDNEELIIEKTLIPSPPTTVYSPMTTVIDSIETSDMTQHPAAVLCDLQCQSEESADQMTVSINQSSTQHPVYALMLQVILQHLLVTMTSAAYSTVILPLNQIFRSLKMGSPLTFSPMEISRHLPLILWLISTPNLVKSKTPRQRSVFRIRLLTRLLACSPAMARPLRDATSKALQLAVRESQRSGSSRFMAQDYRSSQSWELLMTTLWATDQITRSENLPSHKSLRGRNRTARAAHYARAKQFFLRRSRSSRSMMDYDGHSGF